MTFLEPSKREFPDLVQTFLLKVNIYRILIEVHQKISIEISLGLTLVIE